MAEDSTSLILLLLREIRATQHDHTNTFEQHDKRFDSLDKKIEDWQETTATAVGLATHANLRNHDIEAKLAELAARLDRLEKAH
ncbi:MAG: hypothetical protein H0T56_03755 [Pseudaminobacter sp.]|nr:hypothetical protein [Pseudaminobacter sp.]